MSDASIGLSFTEWALGVITSLIAIIFWFTHSKIDGNTAALKTHKEEVKGEFMKNDHDHELFWQEHNKADQARQDRCISRVEYEKDMKYVADAVSRIEGYTKADSEEIKKMTRLLLEHMGKGTE